MTIPPQIPRQLRSILTDILATRKRYLEICSDAMDMATSLVNLSLRYNNSKAKAGRWAPGETDEELGWETVAELLEEEKKETLDYLQEGSTGKLKVQVSRLDVAFQRLRTLVDETTRSYGISTVKEVAALNLLTLERLRGSSLVGSLIDFHQPR